MIDRISVRADRQGRTMAVAVDDDWDQDQIQRVVHDRLNFVPMRPGSARMQKPTRLAIYRNGGEGEPEHYEVTSFYIDPDPVMENKAAIRQYHLGDLIG